MSEQTINIGGGLTAFLVGDSKANQNLLAGVRDGFNTVKTGQNASADFLALLQNDPQSLLAINSGLGDNNLSDKIANDTWRQFTSKPGPIFPQNDESDSIPQALTQPRSPTRANQQDSYNLDTARPQMPEQAASNQSQPSSQRSESNRESIPKANRSIDKKTQQDDTKPVQAKSQGETPTIDDTVNAVNLINLPAVVTQNSLMGTVENLDPIADNREALPLAANLSTAIDTISIDESKGEGEQIPVYTHIMQAQFSQNTQADANDRFDRLDQTVAVASNDTKLPDEETIGQGLWVNQNDIQPELMKLAEHSMDNKANPMTANTLMAENKAPSQNTQGLELSQQISAHEDIQPFAHNLKLSDQPTQQDSQVADIVPQFSTQPHISQQIGLQKIANQANDENHQLGQAMPSHLTEQIMQDDSDGQLNLTAKDMAKPEGVEAVTWLDVTNSDENSVLMKTSDAQSSDLSPQTMLNQTHHEGDHGLASPTHHIAEKTNQSQANMQNMKFEQGFPSGQPPAQTSQKVTDSLANQKQAMQSWLELGPSSLTINNQPSSAANSGLSPSLMMTNPHLGLMSMSDQSLSQIGWQSTGFAGAGNGQNGGMNGQNSQFGQQSGQNSQGGRGELQAALGGDGRRDISSAGIGSTANLPQRNQLASLEPLSTNGNASPIVNFSDLLAASADSQPQAGDVIGLPLTESGADFAKSKLGDGPQQPAGLSYAARLQMAANNPLEQIGMVIQRSLNNGQDRVSLRLHPEELGTVEIKLEVGHNKSVTAQVIVEKSETLQILKQDSQSLVQLLQDSGLQADSSSLNFSLKDQNGQSFSQGQGWAGGPSVRDNAPDDAFSRLDSRNYNSAWSRDGGLDVRA